MFRNIKAFFKLQKLLLKKPVLQLAWYKIVQGMMDFAVEVQKNKKPMLTELAVVDMSDKKIIGDFDIVSIWAGCGNANPIKRIKHLKAQNDAMKELLKTCQSTLEVGGNDNLILNIKIVLDTFE